MDFETWERLHARLGHHLARTDVAGVVVTHGTDTMEETAWFLARTLAMSKPVVLTGAMRPATSAEPDGPGNLADAIRFAARGGPAGVVVAMAGEIHGAAEVRKLHPHRLDAMSSGDAGPLARVDGERMVTLRPWPALPVSPHAAAGARKVRLGHGWRSSPAARGRALVPSELLVDAGVEGLVVSATGNAAPLHRALAAALEAAAARGVAILRSTRCSEGAIAAAHADELPSAGALTPAKARVELLVRLRAG